MSVRPHLVLVVFDRPPAMAPDPEPQWWWQMCKHPIVEAKAKPRKKACINDKGHLDIGIPQRTDSALNGSESTTKPTDRCRQGYIEVTHTRRCSLNARRTCCRKDRLLDLGK